MQACPYKGDGSPIEQRPDNHAHELAPPPLDFDSGVSSRGDDDTGVKEPTYLFRDADIQQNLAWYQKQEAQHKNRQECKWQLSIVYEMFRSSRLVDPSINFPTRSVDELQPSQCLLRWPGG